MKLMRNAARQLFADRGYEAATVRDIAAAANLSTGAVFASFADKADLFNEIILADYRQLHEHMAGAPDDGQPVKEKLLTLLTMAYEIHLDRLRLVQAVLSFSWIRDIRAESGDPKGVRLVLNHLAGVLRQAIDGGELPQRLDPRLMSEMLWDCYVSNYRRAIFDGWDKAALRDRLSSQIDVLLCTHRQAARTAVRGIEVPPVRVKGVRQAGKQATRERVLGAARDLFDEIGYEDATIRMIAQRAAVSVGSVFTTFAGKTEILGQVMDERLSALYAELDQVVPHLRGATVDRLRSIMAVHYSFETRRIRLFIAYIAASYGWQPEQNANPLGRNVQLKGMLADVLRGGMTRGEVRQAGRERRNKRSTLCFAAYIWNYRLASYEGAGVERLTEVMDRQIGLLFEGVAAR